MVPEVISWRYLLVFLLMSQNIKNASYSKSYENWLLSRWITTVSKFFVIIVTIYSPVSLVVYLLGYHFSSSVCCAIRFTSVIMYDMCVRIWLTEYKDTLTHWLFILMKKLYSFGRIIMYRNYGLEIVVQYIIISV
jgi:hypothetical protein